MSPPRHVMLLIETSKVYGRGLLDGIGRYAMTHGQWVLGVEERGLEDESFRLIRSWKGDGIIFRSTGEPVVRAIRRRGVPAVDTNSAVIGHGFPLVYADEERIAQLAVTHFLERRFQHFAFCSVEEPRWVEWRREAFLRELARLGLSAYTNAPDPSRGASWERQHRHLAAWVAGLPKPVAVLAANDVCGTRLVAACRTAGMLIPEQVAVLGVDNDEVLCRLTSPPLSSIDPDSPGIGYRAALLLDEMMDGAAGPTEPIWIPPRGVVTRQSTDVVAVDDPEVADALGFIREHACDGIDVDDLLHRMSISRATLERKFAASLQTTPRQAILRVRIERIRFLLTQTEYPLERIASLAGYKTQSHLSVAFRRETGLTPGDYRRQTQTAGDCLALESEGTAGNLPGRRAKKRP